MDEVMFVCSFIPVLIQQIFNENDYHLFAW